MKKRFTMGATKALIVLPSFMLLAACGGSSSGSNGDDKVTPPQENPSASDQDGDGILLSNDNCPGLVNPNQNDLDGDDFGDACDSDIDGDGFDNSNDAFPYDPKASKDNDGDGIADVYDEDDDNDGYPDSLENQEGTDQFDSSDFPINFVTIDSIFTDWEDIDGAITVDGPFEPAISEQLENFTQTRDMLQKQTRTEILREGDEFSDNIRETGREERRREVPFEVSREVTVDVGEFVETSFCDDFAPTVDEVIKGKSFTQERDCVDSEEREITYSSEGAELSTRTEESILDERTESQDAIGTKTLDNDGDKLVNSYEESRGTDPENANQNGAERVDNTGEPLIDGDEVELLANDFVPVDEVSQTIPSTSEEDIIKFIKNTSVLYFHIVEMENNVNVLVDPYKNLIGDYYSDFEIGSASALTTSEEEVLGGDENQKVSFVNCALSNSDFASVDFHGIYKTGLSIDKQSALSEGVLDLYTKGTTFEADHSGCPFSSGQKTIDVREGLVQVDENSSSFHPYFFNSSNATISGLPSYVTNEIGVGTNYRYIYTDYKEMDRAAELAGVPASTAPFNELDLIMEYNFGADGSNTGFNDGTSYLRLTSLVDVTTPSNSEQIQYKLNGGVFGVFHRKNGSNRLFEYPGVNAAMEADNTNYRQVLVTELDFENQSGQQSARIRGTRLRIEPHEVDNSISNEMTAPFLSGFYSGGRAVTGDAEPNANFKTPKFELAGNSGAAEMTGSFNGNPISYTIEEMEYQETSTYCEYSVRYVYVDLDGTNNAFNVSQTYGFVDGTESCKTKPYRPVSHHINGFNPETDNAEKLWLQY